MRIAMAFLLLCSMATADDIFKPTGRYAVQSSSRQWYLVSESWCVNCPAAKTRFLAKGWSPANVITIAECKARFGFTVPHVPYEFAEPKLVAVHPFSRLQSGCPGGVCPTSKPVQRVHRGGRGFFLWR